MNISKYKSQNNIYYNMNVHILKLYLTTIIKSCCFGA